VCLTEAHFGIGSEADLTLVHRELALGSQGKEEGGARELANEGVFVIELAGKERGEL